jgi:hypothetical protein
VLAGTVAAIIAATALGAEGQIPRGVAYLDQVFLIMMENHAYVQVLGGDETGTVNGTVQGLYAVKHDPFAYFANVQAGTDSRSSLNNIAGFGGRNGSFCSSIPMIRILTASRATSSTHISRCSRPWKPASVYRA